MEIRIGPIVNQIGIVFPLGPSQLHYSSIKELRVLIYHKDQIFGFCSMKMPNFKQIILHSHQLQL